MYKVFWIWATTCKACMDLKKMFLFFLYQRCFTHFQVFWLIYFSDCHLKKNKFHSFTLSLSPFTLNQKLLLVKDFKIPHYSWSCLLKLICTCWLTPQSALGWPEDASILPDRLQMLSVKLLNPLRWNDPRSKVSIFSLHIRTSSTSEINFKIQPQPNSTSLPRLLFIWFSIFFISLRTSV